MHLAVLVIEGLHVYLLPARDDHIQQVAGQVRAHDQHKRTSRTARQQLQIVIC